MDFPRKRFLTAMAAGFIVPDVVPSGSKAAEFEYKLGHDLPESHPVGVGANELAAAVRRESNGRLEIKVFPNTILGTDASMISQLRLGALQLTLQGSANMSAIAPVAAIGLLGFPYPDRRTAIAASDGGVGAVVRKDIEARGVIAFEKAWENGFRHVTTSTHPIRTVEDFAGLKIRVAPSPTTIDLFKTLGAAPIAMDVKELYTSLQTHVIDAEEGPNLNTFTIRMYEVQKYLSYTSHQWSSYWMFMNADAWKALPGDLQEILRRNSNLAGAREQRSIGGMNDAVGDLLVRYGMIRNTADTATCRARLGGYYQRWKNEFGSTAWSALEQYSGKLT